MYSSITVNNYDSRVYTICEGSKATTMAGYIAIGAIVGFGAATFMFVVWYMRQKWS